MTPLNQKALDAAVERAGRDYGFTDKGIANRPDEWWVEGRKAIAPIITAYLAALPSPEPPRRLPTVWYCESCGEKRGVTYSGGDVVCASGHIIATFEEASMTKAPDAALPVPREGEAGTPKVMDAINWLMGCGDDFTPTTVRSPIGTISPFWWRSEFARRAGLTYDAAQGKYVASLTASEGTSDAK